MTVTRYRVTAGWSARALAAYMATVEATRRAPDGVVYVDLLLPVAGRVLNTTFLRLVHAGVFAPATVGGVPILWEQGGSFRPYVARLGHALTSAPAPDDALT